MPMKANWGIALYIAASVGVVTLLTFGTVLYLSIVPAYWALGSGFAFTIGGLVILAVRAERARRVGDLLTGHKCPSCGYDFSGLVGTDMARVTCPECGAAWRVGESTGGSAVARGER